MKKNLAVSALCFAALFAYMVVGFATQAIMGAVPWSEAGAMLGIALVISAVPALALFGLVGWALKRFGRPAKASVPFHLSGAGTTASALVVALAAIAGGWLSHAKVSDERNAEAAIRTRVATERARIAALTPEQHAAEAKKRADIAAAAAQAQAEQARAAQRLVAAKETVAAATKAESDRRTAQLQIAGAGAIALKKSMKDPEAFLLTSLVVKTNGSACYEYRAKNSFGAVFPGSAVIAPGGKRLLVQERDGNAFARAWNKECTLPGGDDITDMIKRLGMV